MRSITLLLLLSLGGLSGNEFWFGGEALLLRPTLSFPYSSIITPNLSIPNNSNGGPLEGHSLGNLNPKYGWGYRIEAGYRCCPTDIIVSWMSWIHTLPTGSRVGAESRLWFTRQHPSIGQRFLRPGALIRLDQILFQCADGDLGAWISLVRDWEMRLFTGLRYARIRHNISVKMRGINQSNQTSELNWLYRSDVQGTGPKVGAKITSRELWRSHAFAMTHAAFLLGTTKGYYFDHQQRNNSVNLVTEAALPANLILTNIEGKFGITHNIHLGGCVIDAQLGYFISYFPEGSTREFFYNDADVNSWVRREAFAVDGWTFYVAVSF